MLEGGWVEGVLGLEVVGERLWEAMRRVEVEGREGGS